jgi:hypothetical protein
MSSSGMRASRSSQACYASRQSGPWSYRALGWPSAVEDSLPTGASLSRRESVCAPGSAQSTRVRRLPQRGEYAIADSGKLAAPSSQLPCARRTPSHPGALRERAAGVGDPGRLALAGTLLPQGPVRLVSRCEDEPVLASARADHGEPPPRSTVPTTTAPGTGPGAVRCRALPE